MSSAGTITRIAPQKRDPERVSIHLDGAFVLGVHVDVVLNFGLAPGQALSEADLEKLTAADARLRAKHTAFAYLSYRARTEYEVRQKLRRGEFEPDVIDEVIERLYALGYLDDEAYARSFARGRFAAKGYGPRRVQMDLQRRGVQAELITAALADVYVPEETLAAARQQAAKRWPRLAREADPYKRKKKLSDFLVRRGFSYDVVRQVVDELASAS